MAAWLQFDEESRKALCWFGKEPVTFFVETAPLYILRTGLSWFGKEAVTFFVEPTPL